MSVEDDLDLARRAAGGADLAFEILVRRHTEAVWRLAYGMLRDHGAAEDVTQDVFVKAYQALARFRGEAAFRTWLLAIAHRTCLDALRRRSAEVVPLERARHERAREADQATRAALTAAVEALPEGERRAFLLVDVLGLSREEAAAVSGVPASTLKSDWPARTRGWWKL
jgi:RNA polymerase sigma-70 factor (ECF subfamily)